MNQQVTEGTTGENTTSFIAISPEGDDGDLERWERFPIVCLLLNWKRVTSF